ILKVKDFARSKGKTIHTVAKIERAEAVKNIKDILAAAEGVMIARGDLGVQLPLEEVPLIQKKIIRQANILGIPVITATQMLESMTENTRPTRAEVADVANAILDGSDALMLSEETAVGQYPVEAVKMMAKIAIAAESNLKRERLSLELIEYFKERVGFQKASIEDTVSLNVTEARRLLKARFILTPTQIGNTPRRISRFKPNCWILAFTRNKSASEFLTFSYGVYPFHLKEKVGNWSKTILKFIKDLKLVKTGDKLILTEGLSSAQVGSTDSLRIITV
ncbi:MAG: pyruvate kinase, partial [Candidatus Aminicenantales bacterium]